MQNRPEQQKQTKLAIVSDLHLDCIGPHIALERIAVLNRIEADYLVMAGDICEMQYASAFLPRIKPKVKNVIVVKGNHEFYDSSLGSDIEYPENFVCLRAGQPYVVDDLAFIGDTLWSHVPIGKMSHVEHYMSDYSMIAGSDGDEITCHETNDLHETQKSLLLADARNHANDKRIVMVTHHSPSFLGVHPNYAGHFANCAFHSDVLDEYVDASPALWIHGHTHAAIDYEHNGTRVVCNPWGYRNERLHELNFSDDIIKYISI